jgi:hypothetical protein
MDKSAGPRTLAAPHPVGQRTVECGVGAELISSAAVFTGWPNI